MGPPSRGQEDHLARRDQGGSGPARGARPRLTSGPPVPLFIVSLALVVATGFAVAAMLRVSFVGTLLAAYLVAFAEVVGLAEVLSPAHAIRRGPYFAAICVLAAASGSWWNRVGRPRPPRPTIHARAVVRHPVVAALLVA